jgi:polyisoprenoid-binding protein YceI
MGIMFRTVTTLAICVMLAVPALGQTTADPSKLESGSYAVEPNHAQIVFGVSHFGFSVYHGTFSGITGQLSLDAKSPANSKLSVTIPILSVSTTVEKLTGELKDPDWFDAAKFPTATFKSTHIDVTSPTTGKITGDLTLHGVTKPVTLDATFFGAGTNPMSKKVTIGFTAKGTVKRSDFGVAKYVPLVGDDVTVQIEAPFEKE